MQAAGMGWGVAERSRVTGVPAKHSNTLQRAPREILFSALALDPGLHTELHPQSSLTF